MNNLIGFFYLKGGKLNSSNLLVFFFVVVSKTVISKIILPFLFFFSAVADHWLVCFHDINHRGILYTSYCVSNARVF